MHVTSVEYSVDQVGDSIPDFIPTDPELWFSIIEDIFNTNQVTTESSKFGYAILALGPYMIEVRDLIVSPPPDPYSKLKQELPKRLHTTRKLDTRCVLEQEENGDRKPSQLLRHLRTLGGVAVTEEAIRKLWMERLPRQIQTILATQRNATLDNAAEMADAIFEVLRSLQTQVATAIAVPSVQVSSSTDIEALVARMTLGFREELTAIREELQQISRRDGQDWDWSNSNRGRSQERRRMESRGLPEPGAVIVRAEEALIVILVLLLWAAAIALFFNRWGKIRMLEPYQPKFQQQHRQSCTTIDQNPLQNRRTYSKCNVLCGDYPAGLELNYGPGQTRLRQNSVFIGSSASLLPGCQGTPRRTKSAFDLQFLILTETKNDQDTSTEQDSLRSCKPTNESTKLLQRERRTSACQLDRIETVRPMIRDRGMSICQFDASPKSWQRDRGMSICQFDRMDVIARPLQRDRGGSICQFDRTDVLARPLQRDRIGSAYHFDRTEVLARPNYTLGKTLLRERRVSVCNFLEKDEEAAKAGQRRTSVSNVDKIERGSGSIGEAEIESEEIFAKCRTNEARNTVYQYDQPSCSKTSDVVFGYKATCV